MTNALLEDMTINVIRYVCPQIVKIMNATGLPESAHHVKSVIMESVYVINPVQHRVKIERVI